MRLNFPSDLDKAKTLSEGTHLVTLPPSEMAELIPPSINNLALHFETSDDWIHNDIDIFEDGTHGVLNITTIGSPYQRKVVILSFRWRL